MATPIQDIFQDKESPALNPVLDKDALGALPTGNLVTGAACYVISESTEYRWSGSAWLMSEGAYSGYYDFVIKSSGTKYSSVGAAVADNPTTPLKLFVDGRGAAVNESANIVCLVGVSVTFAGVWSRGSYKFDFSNGSNVSLVIKSFGKGNTFLGATSANTFEGGVMINKGDNVSLKLENVVISNLSDKDDDGFFDPNGDVSINSCELSLAAKSHSGFDFSECTISSKSYINDLRITGNGPNCSWCYVAGVNDIINGLTIDASVGAGLSTSTTATVITNKKAIFYSSAGQNCQLNNLVVVPKSGLAVGAEYGVVISKGLNTAEIASGASLAVYGVSNNTLIESVNFGLSDDPTYTGGRYIQYQNGDGATIRDSYNLSAIEDFGGDASNVMLERVKFSTGSSPTFGINYTTIKDCELDGLSNISAYGCVCTGCTGSSAIEYDEDSKNIVENFRVIEANLVKDTMFASSYEVQVITDPEEYIPGATYSIDANVIYSGLVYKGLQKGNSGNEPDTSPLFWEPTETPTTQEFTAKYGKMYVTPGVNYAVNIICPSSAGRKGDGFSVFPENLTQSLTIKSASGETINGSTSASVGNPTTTCKVTSLGGTKMISSGTTAPP